MNGIASTLLKIVLGVALFSCFALMQETAVGNITNEDSRLSRYQEIIEILDESISQLAIEPEKSEQDLILAQETFEVLAQGGLSSSAVASGINNTFDNARTAVRNRSEADLNIQVTVIKGGLQRFMYEIAVAQASEGDLDLAKSYFSEIVETMGGEEADISQIKESQDPLVFQAVLDSVASKNMQLGLQDAAAALQNGDTPRAYQAIARAYSNYIPIQDSPRVPENISTNFLGAINAVVNKDSTVTQTLQNLNDSVDGFAEDAKTGLEQALSPPSALDMEALEETPVEEVPLEETPSSESEVLPLQTEDIVSEPLAVEPEPPSLSEAIAEEEPESEALPLPPVVAPTTTEGPTEESTSPSESTTSPSLLVAPPVTNEPTAVAGSAATPPTLTQPAAELLPSPSSSEPLRDNELPQASVNSDSEVSEEALNLLYAKAAQATVAIETGKQTLAKELIDGFEEDYKRFFESLVSSEDPKFAETTNKLISGLKNTPALRLQDSVVLIGHVSAIKSLLENQDTSNTHEAIVATSIFWTGIVRLIAMIALAILAFIPLYFLNLAFGGGNRNWQWVGFALFLLLLPIIYEGFSFAGTLVAGLTGIEFLDVLSTFSFFQNVISQVVWVAITLIAIIFASIGLYGICVQFGLLGRGKEMEASVFDKDPNVTVSDLGDDTIVDWDEEF